MDINMSCVRPFMMYDKRFHRYNSIPCGWCIKCRIDKRMYYKTRFEYSLYKEFKGNGSFCCVTYDDNHIPLTPEGLPTLKLSDSQNFLKRLRSYMNYHKINNSMLSNKFKYIAVGEYGEDLGRCHIHYLFSGLDYAAALPLFQKCWPNGVIIDSRPILAGGINYVLKYIDKQQHGDEIQYQYLDQGREPPFFTCSHSFGFKVYQNFDPKNLTFKYGSKNIPLPYYIKRKWFLYKPRSLSNKICEFASKNHMSYDEANKYIVESQEKMFERSLRMHGEPVADIPLNGQFDITSVIRPRFI